MVRVVLAVTVGLTVLAGAGTAAAEHATEDVYIHTGVSSEEEARDYPCAPSADAEGWERSGPVVCLDKAADVWQLHYEVADDRGCTYHHASGWSGSCVFDLDMGDHIRVWGTSGIQMTTVTVDWGHETEPVDGGGGAGADDGGTGDTDPGDTDDGSTGSGPDGPSGPDRPAAPQGPEAPEGPDGGMTANGYDGQRDTSEQTDDGPASAPGAPDGPDGPGGASDATRDDAPSTATSDAGSADPAAAPASATPGPVALTPGEDAAGTGDERPGSTLLLAGLVLLVSGGLLVRDVRRGR